MVAAGQPERAEQLAHTIADPDRQAQMLTELAVVLGKTRLHCSIDLLLQSHRDLADQQLVVQGNAGPGLALLRRRSPPWELQASTF